MARLSRTADRKIALGEGATVDPAHPPLSAWSVVAAPADGDDGFVDELSLSGDGDDWPGPWGAARLGIP